MITHRDDGRVRGGAQERAAPDRALCAVLKDLQPVDRAALAAAAPALDRLADLVADG